MSKFLNNITFFKQKKEKFADGHGQTTDEDRRWEQAYRQRWQHDKIVRSTHGVNCTGSCSWKIYVKNGLVTWETQQTDYPRTRDDLPNHEPRGCARGASYSWYLYSANRLKYPLIRAQLLKSWRATKAVTADPVKAWSQLMTQIEAVKEYQQARGKGDFVRVKWDEALEIIAAANLHTAKTWGPDRVIGFSPIPAMSMVSYAAGARYLSLLGGTCMSFYDWYCDLPPSSPQIWGEQTDVPESADWYNSNYIMLWGSNVPQTRTPDAHFLAEARYKGTKTVVVTPDYSEASKFSDIWLNPKQGTDAALAMAMGHVILKEFHLGENRSDYFIEYCRQYTDMPFLVVLEQSDKGGLVPGKMVRASDFEGDLGQENNPEWKPVLIDEDKDEIIVPNGTIGSRWGEKGTWNLEQKNLNDGSDMKAKLSLIDGGQVDDVLFPYFGNKNHEHDYFASTEHQSIISHKVPTRTLDTKQGKVKVATVYDLFIANYGIDRSLGDENAANSYADDAPYTPKWQQAITGVDADLVVKVAKDFGENAHKTKGRSMVIVGAAINHWYHMDMIYRGIINMLVMCGCIGQSGGGWAHYVGQEKLRPQTGWAPLTFALDWNRPPRQMNSTSFFYAHTDQWRYETLEMNDILSPLADKKAWDGASFIDCNIRSERMGWLPSAPQLQENPLNLSKEAQAAGENIADYITKRLKDGSLNFSCEDPDNPKNWPRNMFVWRSNILGSSGKGHEYFLKHLLGTDNGVQGAETKNRPSELVWHEKAPQGKLDLLVTLDFRMSTTCVYSDIVLPTASWYEKSDLNTSDMHPFIHPLSAAIDPVWESRSDWEIFKSIAKKASDLAPGNLEVETDIVTVPIQHDTAAELAQGPVELDWKKGEIDPIAGKTMPNIVAVERDYPNLYKKFTSLGPLLDKLGNGGKGIHWNTEAEIEGLRSLNGVTHSDDENLNNRPKIKSDIDATEVILSLAPETNGHVACKAWQALSKVTGRNHVHLAEGRKEEHHRYRDLQAQPRKIISSPTWSGIESEDVSYTAGYTNIHELIPWRTLTGRQQLYQDHRWMRDFGEALCVYKPPVNLQTIDENIHNKADGKQITLNFITPHQKWGIHSTYSDNLLMLTLNRGGPCIWISEIDAQKADIIDNDWVECWNKNGALVARAVVSQRVPEGMSMMYHAQEKIVNTPMSGITGTRGGIHNSVTRAVLKPTHMIGGYAQLSYGFNYYGTVGCNRDEFIVLRKMDDKEITWGDEEYPPVNAVAEKEA